MITPIYVHMDGVRDQLTKLMSHLEEFPTPEEVKETEGASTGPALGFDYELWKTASVASEATRVMLQELATAETVIRAAVEDLVEHDEELSGSADRITAFVDNAVAQVSGEGATGSAGGESSTSTGANDGALGDF